ARPAGAGEGGRVASPTPVLGGGGGAGFSRPAALDGGGIKMRSGLSLQCREQYAEGGSFSEFAVHFDFSAVRLDNHLALKHPDAEPVFLRRLKRAKEQSLDKITAHPAAAVRNP